jgi:hypothetical protein
VRQKTIKVFATALLSGALVLSPLASSHGAEESVTLYLKSLSVDTLTVDLTQNSQNVTIVGILKSAVALKPEDLNCDGLDTPKSKKLTITAMGDDFYRVVCAINYGKASAPIKGLDQVGLEVSDANSNLNWQIVPFNSGLVISEAGKDSFGISRTHKIRLYGYPGTSMGFAIPIALSPPPDYKVPSFFLGPDGYLIFDVVDTPAVKAQAIFSKDKKTMNLKCALPATKVSAQVKRETQVSFWINNKLVNPRGFLGTWFNPSAFNNFAIDKSLKGKSIKFFCASKYVIPESNVVLGYAESTESTLQFPK